MTKRIPHPSHPPTREHTVSPLDQGWPSHIDLPAMRLVKKGWKGRVWLKVVARVYALFSPWITIRVPINFTDYNTWASFGQYRGWVSDHYCDTHDDVPLTQSEEMAYANHECDGDCDDLGCEGNDLPCVVGLRVWTDMI